MGTIFTPLRYPGGKSALAPLLASTIEANGLCGGVYAEPFAGGAGAAIKLLYAGVVSKIAINDADPCIKDFWLAILQHTEGFLKLLADRPVSIEEWRRQRLILNNTKFYDQLERGFATFYLNRVNRSGILDGYPIGGINQDGPYLIDARYNKKNLTNRIERLAKWGGAITFTGLDAFDFLNGISKQPAPPFVFLDPPYVAQGHNLYLNAFKEMHHIKLAKWLATQPRLPWVLTYDDNELIHKLYPWCEINTLSIRYSAQVKRCAKELLISPHRIRLDRGESRRLNYAANPAA